MIHCRELLGNGNIQKDSRDLVILHQYCSLFVGSPKSPFLLRFLFLTNGFRDFSLVSNYRPCHLLISWRINYQKFTRRKTVGSYDPSFQTQPKTWECPRKIFFVENFIWNTKSFVRRNSNGTIHRI